MKVLHAYSGNLYGGLEGMLVTIARSGGAVPQLESHFALCFDGMLAGDLRTAGASVHMLHPVRMSRPWTVWLARQALKRVIRSVDPDVVICHSPWPLAILGPTVRRAGKPLVFWTHQYLTGRGFQQRWASWCRPNLVVCNSRYTLGSVANMFPRSPAEVVYCPYTFRPDKPADELRQAVRSELDTRADARVVVQVSRLEWWKGQRLHLAALGCLRELPGWVCWLVGGVQRPSEARYLTELKTLAENLGIADRVRFPGHRRDISRILAAADVVCHPNETPEHFGIAFVEALMAGRPVIATRMGGALEIIHPDCGILTEPNPVALAAALEELLADPARCATLGAAGPSRAVDLCDPRRNLTRLHELLLAHIGEAVCHGT